MVIDLERRHAAMSRSQKLGHCVCNLRQVCPCPELTDNNICHCAGERPDSRPSDVALTKLVRKAGCASKIGQADLLRIVKNLPATSNPNVLLGTVAGDDAGVYRLDDQHSLVQTVDVFTPCVDDPFLFGQIAAANSVSDVYAMGGRPLTALSIIAFPIDELDGAIMEAILKGGIEKLEEAECSLLGGHSINDPEIKCGFAVTGLMPTASVVARDCARPGDVLVLTKALGTGLIAFAASLGRAPSRALAECGAAMATLNRDAAELMIRYGAHACTDITGYGLAGHLAAMVRGSGVDAEIDLSATPVFAAAAECLKHDLVPGALDRNQAYASSWIQSEGNDGRVASPILYDPQTSGGLLVALPESQARRYIDELRERGHAAASIIGRVVEKAGHEGRVVVRNMELKNLIGAVEPLAMSTQETKTPSSSYRVESPEHAADCCSPAAPQTADTSLDLFADFMRAANKPGLIDARAKKLMAIALAIGVRCKPCVVIHIRAALGMGISRAEIDEAAGLAIAFGGCSALMLYKEVWSEVEHS